MTELPGINKQVLEEAYNWLGTPYRHQARCKGAGCDCVGLILGIYEIMYGPRPQGFNLPNYTPHWAEETHQTLLVHYADDYLDRVENMDDRMPGDVLMFRMVRNQPTKHCGIMVDDKQLIHAYARHGTLKSAYPREVGSAMTHVYRFREKV